MTVSTRSTRRGRGVIVLLAVVSLLMTVLAGTALAKKDKPFDLTILHNNDGESQLIDAGSGLEDFGGVARFATVVKDAKKAAKKAKHGVLLVSSGDNFLAGPEFTAGVDAGVYYDALALDMLKYDAIAIGNHDFDFGPEVLAEFIDDFKKPGKPPYLSANLDFSGEPALQALVDDEVIMGYTVVKEKGQKIGIIGATTPNLPFISSPRNVVVDPDVAGVVQDAVDALEAEGINKIILISHLQGITEDLALAAMLDGVDVMIAGGGDELLANPGDLLIPGDIAFDTYPIVATDMDGTMVPVVTTSGAYRYLGNLNVSFDADGNVTGWDGGPIRVAGGEEPDAVKPKKKMLKKVVDPVAEFLAELDATVIATSEVDLDGIRNTVRSLESNEGNLISDALRWQAAQLAASFGVPVPDVALQNGGGIRNDSIIAAGPITELDTFDMVPFPNFLAVFPAIPRTQFKEILENAVSSVNNPPGTGGSGRFAQVSGLSFVWDQAGTAQVLDGDGNVVTPGTKVRDVVLDDGTVIVAGGAVMPGPDLTVATIDFLARGGDQYPFRTASFTVLGVSYQQALSNYIQTDLAGLITAADYPFGGEGRITRLN